MVTKTNSRMVEAVAPVVNVKDFGAVGDGVADDTAAIQAAIDAGSRVVFPSGSYLLKSTINLKDNSELYGSDKAIIKYSWGSFTYDNVINGATKENIFIENLAFVGNGVEANTVQVVSVSESVNCTMRNLSFKNVHGTCIRLNKSTGANISAITFNDVTGVVGAVGEGIYSLGLHDSSLTDLYCNNLGDHLLYLQGDEANAIDSIDNVVVKGVRATSTGANGLTNGAAIVLYGKVDGVTISDALTINCPTAIRLASKPQHLNSAPSNVTINSVVIKGAINRGIHAELDAATTVKSKGVTISDVVCNSCNGAWAYEFKSINGLTLNGITCIDGSGGGISVTDCLNFTSASLICNDNINGYGLFVKDTVNGSITGGLYQRNLRAGIALSGNCERVYVNNPTLLPTWPSGSADTFVMDDTARYCNVQNITMRNEGNVVNSNIYAGKPPSEGYWYRGDKCWSTSPEVTGCLGWVCTIAGTGSTAEWKKIEVTLSPV